MCRGFWLWEAQSVVFYVSGGGLGGSICGFLRVWKAPGGSFRRVSRGSEAPGCPITNDVKAAGGVPRKGTYASFTRAGLSCV